LTQSGLLTSVRRLFAFFEVDDCNGDITTVRLKVEENQLVDVFGEIGTRVEGLKGA